MQNDLNDQQLRKVSFQLGLPSDFIRKDYFVTKAIQILTAVEDDYFSLVFQGGTSLSKAYQVIQRLSEDVDFRVVEKSDRGKLGKDARRKKLRNFRHKLITALEEAGFSVPREMIRVFYEGRFMGVRAIFEGSKDISYLKPHIAIDCFLGSIAMSPYQARVTSLIKLTLGDECSHESFCVNCLSLDETAAEKWVALTRRVSNSKIRFRESDKHLVRHLYDLYSLSSKNLLAGSYLSIIGDLIKKDGQQFKKYNPAYVEDPLAVSKSALDSLIQEPHWEKHWETFLDQMVYEKSKPSFHQACFELNKISQKILATLEPAGVV